jgi:rhamnosyltransferase subunit B
VSRIILAAIGSLGDLHPHLAMALALRQRGHSVAVATHQEYRGYVEALNLEFHRMRPDNIGLDDPEEMARVMDLRKGTEYVLRECIGSNVGDTYEDLLAIAQGADLILCGEGVVSARLVAEKLCILWGLCILQPISFMSAQDPSVLPNLFFSEQLVNLGPLVNQGIKSIIHWVANDIGDPVRQLRNSIGLPAAPGNPFLDDKNTCKLVLALFSKTLAAPQSDWPGQIIQPGFVFYDGDQGNKQLDPNIEQFLSQGEPPILFTLGSAAVITPGSFYAESVKAIALLTQGRPTTRAILLLGRNAPAADLPDNILAVKYAPYAQVFPRAAAIVHQGGIGTTAQAMRAGTPTLIMPYSHDQPDNARRVEKLGTSKTLGRDRYRSTTVAPLLKTLLEDPSYRQRAQLVSKQIKQEDGIDGVVVAIEKYLKPQLEI